ncbi:MAG: chalcone isomerase family protein, partial [bacterium]
GHAFLHEGAIEVNGRRLRAAWLAGLIVLAAPAAARIGDRVSVEGAEFATIYHEASTRLQLAGYGVATARVFFDVYAAALYVPQSTPRGRPGFHRLRP